MNGKLRRRLALGLIRLLGLVGLLGLIRRGLLILGLPGRWIAVPARHNVAPLEIICRGSALRFPPGAPPFVPVVTHDPEFEKQYQNFSQNLNFPELLQSLNCLLRIK